MSKENPTYIRLDVLYAFDADLNKVWRKKGERPSPREKLTIEEVLEVQKRKSKPDTPSQN